MTLEQTIRQLEQDGEAGGNPRYDILKAMQEDGAVDIPFVVIAMTRAEAGDLFDGKEEIFSHKQNTGVNSKQAARFLAFTQAFRQIANREAWCEQYSENHVRETWIPLSCDIPTITLIEQAAIDYYRNKRSPDGGHYASLGQPRFFWPDFRNTDEGLFAPNARTRLQAWGKLHKHYNSVLVIDGISLFHPFIREVLKASPLGWRNKHVGVLILFPETNSPLHPLVKQLEKEIQAEMSVAFACFDQYAETLYQFGIDKVRDLTRWLHTNLNDLVPRTLQANPENVQQVRADSRAPDAAIVTGGA